MNLVIDAGNTFIKYAVFSDSKIIIHGKVDYVNYLEKLQGLVNNNLKLIGYSSVKKNAINDFLLQNKNIAQFALSHNNKFPFLNSYTTPNTIGIDRLVACSGAYSIQKKPGFVVIDAGTCITYDIVDENNCYLGGAISPGLQMRIKAMNNYTDQLPLISPNKESLSLIGNSTFASINSGVLNGISFEMNGFIEKINQNKQKFNIYLTGGDADFFENALKSSIFAEPLLNLKGINDLIKINA